MGIQRKSGIDPTGPGNTDSRGSDGRNHDSGPEAALWCITERIQEKFRKIRRRSIRTGAGKYSRMGLLKIEGDRIALTRAGISVSNPIMADFLLDE